MMNKGTIYDIPIIVFMLFGSAVAILLAAKVYDDFSARWTPEHAEAQAILDQGVLTTRRFNYGFLIYGVGLGLSVIIGAFLIRTHVIFFPISLILLALIMLVVPQVSNAFETFIQNSIISSMGNDFGVMVTFMRNLPIIIMGIGFLILLALYAKPQIGSA